MADTTVTIRLHGDEYRRLRHELENQLQYVKGLVARSIEGKWSSNPDGLALKRRQLFLQQLLERI